jgi:hydrogenase maturation protein HypF
MAEAGLIGPVIGVAYDGTGYGEDGTVWGGEILISDRCEFRRAMHLLPVPMPGGEAAVRHPARMALSYLLASFPAPEAEHLARESLPALSARELTVVSRQIGRGLNSPFTSSMGRLFDAVGALLGASSEVTYEGQPAMELETMAEEWGAEAESYPYAIDGDTIDVRGTVQALLRDRRAGLPRAQLAARFHETVVAFTVTACRRLCDQGAPPEVVLSGGVMQNARLVSRLLAELEMAGLRPHTHREVPPNDGGLSLGQAVVAAERSRA